MASRKKVIVLGSNAFCGQDFIDLLLSNPQYDVIGISRSPENPAFRLRYRGRDDLSRFRFERFDFNDEMDSLLKFLDAEKPEIIVNFAAQSEVAPSWSQPQHWYQTNCVALATMINHLNQCDYLERFVHISTPEVYGECTGVVSETTPVCPTTPYAATKAAGDLLLQLYSDQFGFPALIVRATNVYGARQQLHKLIPRSVVFLKMGRTIDLHGGGQTVKSFMHVRDASRGELAIMEHGRVGQIYHLSPLKGISVRDVVERVCDRMGADFEKATQKIEERRGQDRTYILDATMARHELSWSDSISFDEGIDEVIHWTEQNWTQIAGQSLEYIHRP